MTLIRTRLRKVQDGDIERVGMDIVVDVDKELNAGHDMDNTIDTNQKNEETVTPNYTAGQLVYDGVVIADKDDENAADSDVSEPLTDFSDTDLALDKNDLFRQDENDMNQLRKYLEESLNELAGDVTNNKVDDAFEDEEIAADLFRLPQDSSDDEQSLCSNKYPYFNETTEFCKDIELLTSLQFRNKQVFNKALRYYAVMKGFDFYYVTNGLEKVAAHCRNQACPWRVYASWYKDGYENRSFMIKILVPHLQYCPHVFDNSKVTVKFLTEYYLDAFRKNTKWNDQAFHAHVKDDLKVNVHRMKCFRARHEALQILEGGVGEQFKILRQYCAAILKWNPGSTVVLKTNDDACKREFLAKCRPIISLDSCHLKGHYSGQIHSAVGRDGNDNMFPIAWAICEAETKDTWTWFIESLLLDIGMPKEHGWCFISDQQKCDLETSQKCFNAYIRDARDQPIITCLETIRLLLMKRFQEKHSGSVNYPNEIMPRILSKLVDNKKKALQYIVNWNGTDSFQVAHSGWDGHMVSLDRFSCSCNMWNLTGIPCVHACAAAFHIKRNPDDYIHHSYKKETYMKIYDVVILPIPEPNEWPHADGDVVLPPVFRRQQGRPRKKRIRSVEEPRNPHRIRKMGTQIKCSRCRNLGHNSRRCTSQVIDSNAAAIGIKDKERAIRNRRKKKEQSQPHDPRPTKPKLRNKVKINTHVNIRESQDVIQGPAVRQWSNAYDVSDNDNTHKGDQRAGPIFMGQGMFMRPISAASFATSSSAEKNNLRAPDD
ncbi:hypothetical protein QQ045_025593 [Rhodiola kirilowii]